MKHILRLVEAGKRDGTLVHGGARHGEKVGINKSLLPLNRVLIYL